LIDVTWLKASVLGNHRAMRRNRRRDAAMLKILP
jgi:hypothetical protein